jgi:hypothetical protein
MLACVRLCVREHWREWLQGCAWVLVYASATVRACANLAVRQPKRRCACGATRGTDDASEHTASSVQPYSSALRCDAAFTDPSLNSTAAPSRSGNSLPRPIRQCPLRGKPCRAGLIPCRVGYHAAAGAARQRQSEHAVVTTSGNGRMQATACSAACVLARLCISACPCVCVCVCVCGACAECVVCAVTARAGGRTSRSCRLRRRTPRPRTAAAAAATACNVHSVRRAAW